MTTNRVSAMSRSRAATADPPLQRASISPAVLIGRLAAGLLVAVVGAGLVFAFFYTRPKPAEPSAQARVEKDRVTTAAPEGPRATSVKDGGPGSTVQPVPKPPGPVNSDATPAGMAAWVTIDGVSVRVVSVEIGKAQVYSSDKTLLVEDKQVSMLVKLEVRAEGGGRTYQYRTWRSPASRFATDDAGIAYPGRLGSFSAEYSAFASSRSFGEGDPVADTLVFDPPAEEAKFIDLKLPGNSAGVEGTFHFRIPREQWAKK
jgi:hypothetical protein